ncbi:hypothetical protein [Streptomyces sp. A012304]|uniref:hypothetical protein n=1 Tax=Streptomyces sp. A012304 TaxID=375446 RepID=UPI0022308A7E|nr:hypothetical protein [Streptomyces sp. A012304]GKQ35880.1 hypothetical protein ALMP_24230 [Streptomyces sp. A012304]
MARLRGGTAMRPAGPGRARWVLVAAAAALPALILIWLVTAVVRGATSDDRSGRGPREVACAEALEFGGATLPEEAYDTKCTVQAWQDVHYSAEFRMPRTAALDWLERTYPQAPEPRNRFCVPKSADLCLSLDFSGTTEEGAGQFPGSARPGFGAAAAQVSVEYEGADGALVRFSAFTM